MEMPGTSPYKRFSGSVLSGQKKKREEKRKKAVYWLSTLRVSLKCNHHPNWPYLLYIQAAPGVAGALLFINI